MWLFDHLTLTTLRQNMYHIVTFLGHRSSFIMWLYIQIINVVRYQNLFPLLLWRSTISQHVFLVIIRIVNLNFWIILVDHTKRVGAFGRCQPWKFTCVRLSWFYEQFSEFLLPIRQNIVRVMILAIWFQNRTIILEINFLKSSMILTFVGYSLIILLLCLVMIHDVFHLLRKHLIC